MEYKGLILDKFQEDSIRAIENNHSVVVSAPTGSGKTLIADYIIDRDVKKGIRVIYTAPIKALSNQKYKEFTTEYGVDKIGLLTGDIVINSGAPVLIMTTEIYRNMALTNDKMIENVSYVVFDEIHFINDIERGYVWEESIIFSKDHVRFLCLSATIPNSKEFADWIQSIKKHKVETVKHEHRSVPLHKKFYDAELGITTLEDIREVRDIPDYRHVMGGRRGRRERRPRIKAPNHVELIREIKDKLPCFFFNFSRQRCQDFALELAHAKLFEMNPAIGAIMRKRLDSAPPEVRNLKSTQVLRQTLPYGVAFHHAGLIPIIKLIVEELFSKGMINVLYATETFAVGINMPAKTVCFQALRKFDGANFRFLNSKEFFQIAGRAGRRGIDKEGFVYSMIDRRDFDYPLLKSMTSADTEPIKSQFRLSVNTVLNLVKMHTAEEIDVILNMSFYTYQQKTYIEIRNSFRNICGKLVKKEYITKDNKLTPKGEFSSKIYSDEIIIGDIFGTDFYRGLNEYQIMLIIACLCYEAREKTEFYKNYQSKFLSDLKRKMPQGADKRFHNMDKLTALIHPCYYGKTIFEMMKNVNLLEGDLIRFFRQMIDKFAQIANATDDFELRQMARNCQGLIITSLADIDAI
ncbi:MAG: DEAD/DEAH box helicase [Nanoarchaeota archaeon]|nr:DEAD/DEAH box helicase [Nanoarchaeota archaeon]MBU1005504.1 DEAD/DEAH box helicase [Nanoarchaeota archaeon]MBU1945718.1 DEAD/DEAH box helicase [Nanoarchaeota archaeon]